MRYSRPNVSRSPTSLSSQFSAAHFRCSFLKPPNPADTHGFSPSSTSLSRVRDSMQVLKVTVSGMSRLLGGYLDFIVASTTGWSIEARPLLVILCLDAVEVET